MRWFTFFLLLLVESCTRFAFSINAKQFKDSGQLGIDADSGSSAFGADERENPSDEARQSSNNYESGGYDNVSGERAGGVAAIKELLGFTHYKTEYQQLGRVEFDVDEQLSHLLKELSPQTFQRNSEEQLSTFPRPRDLFISSQFTRADLKSGRIILWLKYFDAHGLKHGLSDNLKNRYEAYDLLMSIDGVNKKDLADLLKKIKDDSGLKDFRNSMKDVVKQESRLHTLLKNDKNTPESVFSELEVKVSQDDLGFFQWLRYCQLYKTKYHMLSKEGKDFDFRIVDMLRKGKTFDELFQLLIPIRKTVALKTFAGQLLTATRGQKWLEEKKLPLDLYADLIKADVPVHNQLSGFVQWLEYVSLCNEKQATRSKLDVVEFLAPQKNPASLLYVASIFNKLKNVKSVKDTVADVSEEIFKIMKQQNLKTYRLKSDAKIFRWLYPNDEWNQYIDNAIDGYSRFLSRHNPLSPTLSSTKPRRRTLSVP